MHSKGSPCLGNAFAPAQQLRSQHCGDVGGLMPRDMGIRGPGQPSVRVSLKGCRHFTLTLGEDAG
jgi:hypothetical protein